MKKKKDIFIEEEEKLIIYQIDYGTSGLIRKKDGFHKSEVCSPFHGTNVLDRNHFLDNSGTVDIDYGYDFIREEKHISDEELEKRHGTKYYEFTFLNSEDDLYKGSDYSKEKPKEKQDDTKKIDSSFISSIDDILEEDTKPVITDEMVNDKITDDFDNEEAEFKIKFEIDDDEPTYEYNSFDKNMPKPTQANIPSFLTSNSNNKNNDVEINEEFSYSEDEEITIDADEYENPAVDKSLTIEEAILNMQKGNISDNSSNTPKYKANLETKPEISKTRDYSNYHIPYEDFFKKSKSASLEAPIWLEEKKEIINQSLKSFGIEGEVITYTKGPAFTRYEIMLAPGVNVKKVSQIYDNLQKDLQAKSLRLQAPIPGKNTIGIEVPNDVSEVVSFGDILNEEFIHDGKPLRVAMGKNIDGTPVYQNITDMPHALIAGATQSGKSVSINTILVSLLVKNSPDNLKLILVDPKKVELSFYNDLPHLATPVIDDAVIATEALKWAVREMERRYDVLARNRVRNIGDYNKKRANNPEMEKMPFIVIVVDEFNDMVMQCGVDANEAIIRLAQKARACGIHIILATQRPTADVVNGTIKANITCRIAFRVAANLDSRIILDEDGAENLLGRGDMIIKNNSTPVRAQGAYISDDEIDTVCQYICERYEPDFLFTHEDLKRELNKANGNNNSSFGKEASSESEELLYQIALACVQQGTCSINSIQTGFGLGFNRAQRIVQILEDREIVSPKNGTKGREILVDSYKLREMFGIDD